MFAMRPKVAERRRAREMRARGSSLRQIASELGVALSSASTWTRDVSVPSPTASATAVQPPAGRSRSEYFRQRGDLHVRQTYEARWRRREIARTYVLELLASAACADCGLRDPVVFEFDHLTSKREGVAQLVTHGYSLRVIIEEIEKCEIVCANCHRHRTAESNGWLRGGREAPTYCENRPLRRRNLEFIREYLATRACVDCGEGHVVVLEFDHIGPKRATVAKLAWQEHSLASLKREIAECQVRCANCHRRRTCQTFGHFRQNAAAPVAQLVRAAAF